jgi:hypothetical protein
LFDNLANVSEKMLLEQLLDESAAPAYSCPAYFLYDENIDDHIGFAHQRRAQASQRTAQVLGEDPELVRFVGSENEPDGVHLQPSTSREHSGWLASLNPHVHSFDEAA